MTSTHEHFRAPQQNQPLSHPAPPTAEVLGVLASVVPGVRLPGTPEYDAAVVPWNVAVQERPLAVVEATRAEDVVAAVRFANRHRIGVAVQATGHGAASAFEHTILVSTRGMRGLSVVAPQRWVRAEAGVTWDQVLEAGAVHRLAGLCGSAPGVGVVGYTTGGGIGPVARTHGLASDQVRAFEVVTGDGEFRRATPSQHPDLYWGLRGGKGMLGIVTSIEFDLLPIADLYGGAVYFDGADAPEVLRAWSLWQQDLPAEATTSVALLRLPDLPGVPPPLAGRLTLAVRFAWTGEAAEGERVLAPMRAAATPVVDTVAVMPYGMLGAIHADPVEPMPTHEEHALLRALPGEAVETILQLAGPASECPQVIVEIRQLGGAVAQGAPSAYDHRDAAFAVLTIGIGVPPVVGPVTEHGTALLQALEPWATPGGLPNFAPRDSVEWLERSYRPETVERLRRTSRAYDPHGVIHAGHLLHRD